MNDIIPITTKIKTSEPEVNQSLIISEEQLTKDFINSLNEVEQNLLANIPCLQTEKKITDISKLKNFLSFQKAKLARTADWLPSFLDLLIISNDSPVKCAETLGISWGAIISVNRKMMQDGDFLLNEAIENSRKAYAEKTMFHPEGYAGNAAMAIFMAKSLAGWSDQTENEFGVPENEELEAIREARLALKEEADRLEHAQLTGSIRNQESPKEEIQDISKVA